MLLNLGDRLVHIRERSLLDPGGDEAWVAENRRIGYKPGQENYGLPDRDAMRTRAMVADHYARTGRSLFGGLSLYGNPSRMLTDDGDTFDPLGGDGGGELPPFTGGGAGARGGAGSRGGGGGRGRDASAQAASAAAAAANNARAGLLIPSQAHANDVRADVLYPSQAARADAAGYYDQARALMIPQKFEADERQREWDRRFKEAEFEYKRAIDARDYESAERWKARADYWQSKVDSRADHADAREQGKYEQDVATTWADQERRDMEVNRLRMNLLGYDPDGHYSGTAGTKTAAQKQQDFANVQSTQDRAYQSDRDAADRAERAAQFVAQQRQLGLENQRNAEDRAESNRRFDVEMQQRGSNSQRQPAVLTLPPPRSMRGLV